MRKRKHLDQKNMSAVSRKMKRFRRSFFTNPNGEPAMCVSYGLIYQYKITDLRMIYLDRETVETGWENQTTIDANGEIMFVFDLKISDNLNFAAFPSIYFVLHDSSQYMNPFKYGVKLETYATHHIDVREIIDQKLLPSPYDTNCSDFLVIGNNSYQYSSREECIQMCHFMMFVERYWCVPRSISISHVGGLCEKGMEVPEDIRIVCRGKCQMPCRTQIFKYKLYENRLPTSLKDTFGLPLIYDDLKQVMIFVTFNNLQVKTISFEPAIMPLDLFSNIGGFLGIWIGSSVVSVVDLLYRAFNFLTFMPHYIKKKKWMKLIFFPCKKSKHLSS